MSALRICSMPTLSAEPTCPLLMAQNTDVGERGDGGVGRGERARVQGEQGSATWSHGEATLSR